MLCSLHIANISYKVFQHNRTGTTRRTLRPCVSHIMLYVHFDNRTKCTHSNLSWYVDCQDIQLHCVPPIELSANLCQQSSSLCGLLMTVILSVTWLIKAISRDRGLVMEGFERGIGVMLQ